MIIVGIDKKNKILTDGNIELKKVLAQKSIEEDASKEEAESEFGVLEEIVEKQMERAREIIRVMDKNKETIKLLDKKSNENLNLIKQLSN